ncbi:MAG: hypothetical protein ACNI3C_12135 [Candidatus Marinarcus sp.]|uniref:hypothetical protein n=1 Tax=Candidatus Marinarcus sp. TaxID=3100987 RepID=UPI003B00FCB5
MKLQGVTIDFNDRKTCGLLPSLCLKWDEKFDALEDNEELLKYWESHLEEVLAKTNNIVSGNMGTKSILYSADEVAIKHIAEVFKDLKMSTLDYDNIIKCEHCLTHDYLDGSLKK